MRSSPVPAVSVVMAAKNYAGYLPTAVGSVLRQTFPDWELVIVDDGSTDSTPAAVTPFTADPRVRYVRSDRLGQSRAKNLGVGLSRGDVITFLDADDAWLPTKLEKQVAALAAGPDVGVCFCRRGLIDPAGERLHRPDPPAPSGCVVTELFLKNFVCFSSVAVRRCVFDHVGGFDPDLDLSIDYDLWLRAARHYKFEYLDDELVLYRTGHGNLSARLADRVATAAGIMTRAVERRGLGSELPPEVIGEGFASTYRALGYTLRKAEPRAAAGWYAAAARWPGRRWEACRGLAACVVAWAASRRAPVAPENATANR
jgi:glycosyltransferase involved in cell wall biosynthesis